MCTVQLIELIKLAQGNRTQNEFALHCGIDSATLTKIIKGGRTPRPDTLKKIASRAYNGVSYEMLMAAAGYIGTDNDEIISSVVEVNPSNLNKFGNRLKEILNKKSITHEELATMANTTGTIISKYINGERTPNIDLLDSIATALDVSTDYLLGKSNNPSSISQSLQVKLNPDDPFAELDTLPEDIQKQIMDYYNYHVEKYKRGKERNHN